MAAITNYNTLIQAIIDIVEDDSAELAAYLPTAIALAEDILFKELDLPDLEAKANGLLSIGSDIIAKPEGYSIANYITVTVNNEKKFLKKRLEDYVISYWPNSALTDVPKYYADSTSSQFKIAPTPDAAYAYEIKYTSKPTKLSVANPTNYYVTNCSEILYYAALVQVALFLKAFDQVNVWVTAFTSTRDAWNENMARLRRDNGTVPQNPSGGPNSLKHTSKTNA